MKSDSEFALRLLEPSPRPSRPLRIAQISPLFESVPPAGYGGTERVVSYLTEALVELGHHVTLFASGDSTSKAKIVPVVKERLGLNACGSSEALAAHTLLTGSAYRGDRDPGRAAGCRRNGRTERMSCRA